MLLHNGRAFKEMHSDYPYVNCEEWRVVKDGMLGSKNLDNEAITVPIRQHLQLAFRLVLAT